MSRIYAIPRIILTGIGTHAQNTSKLTMDHLILLSSRTLLHSLIHDLSIIINKNNDEKKKELEEFIKLVLRISDINTPESEIQICIMIMVGMAQQQKVKAEYKYEIGAVQSGNSSSCTSANRLTPLEKANNELIMYL